MARGAVAVLVLLSVCAVLAAGESLVAPVGAEASITTSTTESWGVRKTSFL